MLKPCHSLRVGDLYFLLFLLFIHCSLDIDWPDRASERATSVLRPRSEAAAAAAAVAAKSRVSGASCE